MEGDLLTVVKWLSFPQGTIGPLNPVLRDLLAWKQMLQIMKVTRIYHEGNSVADILATQVRKAEFTISSTELVWPELAVLLMADARGVFYER